LTGKPLANIWMHNGMLQLGGEKMSKSLGNLITIDEFLSKRSADVLRMLIFTGHYRKPVLFNDETLSGAERGLARLRSALRTSNGSKTVGQEADSVREATENACANFIAAMDDDFNTSTGLAALFELARAINSSRDAGVTGPFYEAAQRTLRELAGILGLTLEGSAQERSGNDVAAKPFIDLLIAVRADLRAAKQWALSDKVRDSLKELGVQLEDSPEGTQWRYQEPSS
jgi:cysteinyl-tRNA synthetase